MKIMVSILLSLLLAVPVCAVTVSEHVKANEGLRLKAYTDIHGYVSIGYGRNLQTRGISKAMAELMLKEDIESCESSLEAHYPWYLNRKSSARTVLIDMCINLGFTGLTQFKKMIRAIYLKDYPEASIELLDSKYAMSLPRRAKRNVKLLLEN
jgi:lysozyme